MFIESRLVLGAGVIFGCVPFERIALLKRFTYVALSGGRPIKTRRLLASSSVRRPNDSSREIQRLRLITRICLQIRPAAIDVELKTVMFLMAENDACFSKLDIQLPFRKVSSNDCSKSLLFQLPLYNLDCRNPLIRLSTNCCQLYPFIPLKLYSKFGEHLEQPAPSQYSQLADALALCSSCSK